MTGRVLFWAVTVASAFASIACDEEVSDPGPFEVDGWIARCEDRCDQLHDCSYDQLVFEHGDLDNCKGSCEYRLDYEDNLAFVEGTKEECLEALYDYVGCVFGLGCEDLSEWSTGEGDELPCAAEEQAKAATCEGIETGSFLDDCGYPSPPQ